MRYLLRWGEPEDTGWPADWHDWLCYCGSQVSVVWSADCSLYCTDDFIVPADANSNSWRLTCHNGHVLLLCHEMGDETGDTYPAPTTQEIVERLASPEDVAAWRRSFAEATS